jgi:hypothetical protein
MVEPPGCGIWLDPRVVLQRQRAGPVPLHHAVPPAGSGIVAHEGAVCDFEGGVKTQQVLGHLDRLLARPLARQHLAPVLWLSHDPIVDCLFYRGDRVLSAAVDEEHLSTKARAASP